MKRVHERLTLDFGDLNSILDNGYVVDIGKEPGFNRQHLLLYSPRDQEHFVAIQDALTGTVVTILPLDYHKNLAWDVTTQQLKLAQERATAFQKVSRDEIGDDLKAPTFFVVQGLYHDKRNMPKTTKLLKWPADAYGKRIERLMADDAFLPTIKAAAAKKNISHSIWGLSIRLGNKGNPVCIELLA